jgi:hypothetical protein
MHPNIQKQHRKEALLQNEVKKGKEYPYILWRLVS